MIGLRKRVVSYRQIGLCVYHKVLLSECSKMDFKVAKTDIIWPSYGRLKLLDVEESLMLKMLYCEI